MTNQELFNRVIKFVKAKPDTQAIRRVSLRELMARDDKEVSRLRYEPGQTCMLQDLDFWWEVAYCTLHERALDEVPQAGPVLTYAERNARVDFMTKHRGDVFARFVKAIKDHEDHLQRVYGIALPIDLGEETCTNA